MFKDVLITSTIDENDFESLLESIPFPLTKAEIVQIAKRNRVSSDTLRLLRDLPSRFYRSKNELIGQCIVRSIGYQYRSTFGRYA